MSHQPSSFLDGLTVVEFPGEYTFYAGALLAMFGADVIVVEPPGGHEHRTRGPRLVGRPDIEEGLFWWHFYRGRRSAVIDLEAPDGPDALLGLLQSADVFLEGDERGVLDALGLTYPALQGTLAGLVWTSITAFGQAALIEDIPATDLTLMAASGQVWSCGYDDHDIPPVRPGEHHAAHTAGVLAAVATLAALWERFDSGLGQQVDVSAAAALNVTTEAATFSWLVAQQTVQRLTARHAAVEPSPPGLVPTSDGHLVQPGNAPLRPEVLSSVADWLESLGFSDDGGGGGRAPEGGQLDARDALRTIAAATDARQFFLGAQARGVPAGIVYAPEDVLEDEHFRARGSFSSTFYEDLGRVVADAGPPFIASATPCVVDRPAPRLAKESVNLSLQDGAGRS